MMELLSKGFCFGFDLTDLFDLHLGYIPLYGFRDCGVIWLLIPISGFEV